MIGTVTRERDLDLVSPAVALAVALDQLDPATLSGSTLLRAWSASSRSRSPTTPTSTQWSPPTKPLSPPYATRSDHPEIRFWPMLFANLTIRLLDSDDFPAPAKHHAAADLTTAAREGALSIPIGDPLALEHVAPHDRVDARPRQRVLVKIPH